MLAGSTRLKAGTAQKMICNMITTGAMARLGYVYGNLMVNLQMKNQKLTERGIAIVQRVAKADRTVAITALKAADSKVPVALVMLCAKGYPGRGNAAAQARPGKRISEAMGLRLSPLFPPPPPPPFQRLKSPLKRLFKHDLSHFSHH